MLGIIQSALEIGIVLSIVVLALYLSYSNLNVCDLSTDGCFTLGAAVGCMVALTGHPYLAILAAIGAGIISGLITAFLQTVMGMNSLLAGIVVNTGLYSINIAVMNNSSIINLVNTKTIYSQFDSLVKNTFLDDYSNIIVSLIVVILVIVFISLLLKTRLGLAIRATGDNVEMVKSSSISPIKITLIGLGLSNGLTGLAGCLYAFSRKSADIYIGQGVVTIALASLLIGSLFFKKQGVTLKAIGCVIGAIIFRFIYALALRFNMPSTYLNLVSSIIIIIAICSPTIKDNVLLTVKKFKTQKKEIR